MQKIKDTVTTFSDLGISKDLTKGLSEMNITEPSEVQSLSIPILLQQNTDFIGQAQTGTGKTAAFGLPLLQKIDTKKEAIQGLILAPTRELCQQIAKQLFKFTKYTDKIFIEAVYGGADIQVQIQRLKRPTHIVVATPGRLMDLIKREVIDISQVKYVVMDEADEMLSMGFKPDMYSILDFVPAERTIWLFSATMPDGIREIISKFLRPNAQKIEVGRSAGVNANISHEYVVCHSKDKVQEINHFLSYHKDERGMIFCQTKNAARILTKQLLAKNIAVDVIEGDMGQRDRDKVMRMFKSQKIELLVATDIAARGIDVKGLSFVLHYQLPQQIEYYTHRSGRTGRAGLKGTSILFISEKEKSKIYEIEKELKIKIKELS
ncbi:DEAD/DEAH box helicase [Roseivirga sp.]|uniref:DEAD/DEAH box helicase n=1 Tax=Roseivirga sp. TaxID=1964215 RepID=UPI002B276B92|nr:DEAD/DEAH box helicase [Roseivirga sp.]